MEAILQEAKEITSDYQLDDVNTPFRIFAGPGAGKTYWLVEHIKHVIEESDRLGPSRRIASISYTSVAADELKKRLGSAAAHVDVSTIHSFLYRNVVRPYLPWLRDEDGDPIVDFWNVDGHRPHRSSKGKINKWFELDEVSDWPNLWAFLEGEDVDKGDLFEFFESLYWDWDEEGQEWKIRFKWMDFLKEASFPYSTENLYRYKRLFWEQGVIDHSDVLYFAAQIISEYPNITKFLSSRYPYVFVDEFQDTIPSQTTILYSLAEEGTVTGVIGDIEQSIYSFTGATPDDFLEYYTEGQKTYHITENRRSTEPIIEILNHIRKGGTQRYHEDGEEGEEESAPIVLIGSPKAAQDFVQKRISGEVQVLTRRKEIVRQLAGADLPEGGYDGVWQDLFASKKYRAEWLEAVLEATREANGENPRYGNAIRILYRALRTKNGYLLKEVFSSSGDRKISRNRRRRTAASLLPFLLKNQEEHRELDGLQFYLQVREQMGKLLPETPMVEPTSGEFKELLENTSYEVLYATARLTSGDGKVKTIHKSKGEEYSVVLVYRGQREKDDRDAVLDHLLQPTNADNEERRVTYVAFSRAEDQLYICVESLSEEEEKNLNNLDVNLTIQYLNTNDAG